jgi:DNA-binding transcriptional ArsR family regulator
MALAPVATNAGRPAGRPAAVSEHGLGDPVCIELSAAQVEQVVRMALDAGRMSVLLSGLGDLRAMFAAGRELLEDDRLSRSLLYGLLVLASLSEDGSYVRVTGLARMLGVSPSTAHRYLSTLSAAGLVRRDPDTRRYRLADAG